MRTLVTGGSGFIGSHLCEKLIGLGHDLIILDNFSIGRIKNLKNIKGKYRIFNADIRDYKKIIKFFKNVDNVYHLAALADIVPSIEKPDEYFSTNVTGTFNVLQASVLNKVKRFIYSASSSCYGIPNKFPTNEDSPIQPLYPYALTKRLGEELVLHYSNLYNLNATSLRFFNVYGPRARTTGTYGAVFGVFLAQKLAKKPFTVVGNGRQTRDFTYVSDVIDALIEVLDYQNLKSEILNVGSGKTISVNKIVKLLGGKKIYIPKRPGEPDITFADIKKIKKLTNWMPKISIEQGIDTLLQNIDNWRDAPLWTPKKINKATKKWFYYLSKR
jgi:UDP-glucose 4-epimerase